MQKRKINNPDFEVRVLNITDSKDKEIFDKPDLEQTVQDNYKPTRKEVLKGIFGNSKKNLGQFSKGFYEVSTIPYIIPFCVRDSKNAPPLKKEDELFNWENASTEIKYYDVGGVMGIVGWVAQAVIYAYVAKHGYPEALLIPVITNASSGLYEGGRVIYKSTEKKLIEEHKK